MQYIVKLSQQHVKHNDRSKILFEKFRCQIYTSLWPITEKFNETIKKVHENAITREIAQELNIGHIAVLNYLRVAGLVEELDNQTGEFLHAVNSQKSSMRMGNVSRTMMLSENGRGTSAKPGMTNKKVYVVGLQGNNPYEVYLTAITRYF